MGVSVIAILIVGYAMNSCVIRANVSPDLGLWCNETNLDSGFHRNDRMGKPFLLNSVGWFAQLQSLR